MGARDVNLLDVSSTTHSSPSSVKVENDWGYVSGFPVWLQCVYGDSFTFTYTTVFGLLVVTTARPPNNYCSCTTSPAKDIKQWGININDDLWFY
jgi:hypothetical protein